MSLVYLSMFAWDEPLVFAQSDTKHHTNEN